MISAGNDIVALEETVPERTKLERFYSKILTGDELELFVHCSKGTYIRTLVEDIGLQLGCGGHVIL